MHNPDKTHCTRVCTACTLRHMDKDSVSTYARVTLSLPPETLDKLDRIAAAEGRSRSNAVARIITRVPEPK
jgi:hypothetical protein